MRIVLGEAPDTHEAVQRAGWLVPVNRAEFRNTHTVQIGVLTQLASKDPVDVDPQIALLEGLLNLRFAAVTSGGETAEHLDSVATPVYDEQKLEEAHQYVGVVTVRFVQFED